MKKLLVAGLSSVLLVGCASTPMNYKSETKQISRPPIGSVNVASLGDELLTQGHVTESAALYVEGTQKLGFGHTIHQGFFPKTGEDANFEYFSISGADGKVVDILGLVIPAGFITLRKSDNAVCIVNAYGSSVACKTGLAIEKKNWAKTGSNSFQQTLLYNGKVGNKINIAYREFSSDHARPAFNNDVEYDLSESNQIGYKGALLEVIEANNQMIKYKVIRNFNSQ